MEACLSMYCTVHTAQDCYFCFLLVFSWIQVSGEIELRSILFLQESASRMLTSPCFFSRVPKIGGIKRKKSKSRFACLCTCLLLTRATLSRVCLSHLSVEKWWNKKKKGSSWVHVSWIYLQLCTASYPYPIHIHIVTSHLGLGFAVCLAGCLCGESMAIGVYVIRCENGRLSGTVQPFGESSPT